MFNNNTKSLSIVYTMNLTITFSNESRFVFVNSTTRYVLDLVNPFALNDIPTKWGQYQDLGMDFPLKNCIAFPWLLSIVLLGVT